MERSENIKDGSHEYDVIKEYMLESAEIEKETMQFLRVMWNHRQGHERVREYGLSWCDWRMSSTG